MSEEAATAERAAIAIQVGRIDAKLDALKENVDEVKSHTTLINGRLRKVERDQAFLKGGVAALTVLIPFALFVAQTYIH